MYRPILISGPTDTPISLSDVKRHVVALDYTDDDAYLQSLIDAAVAYLDGWTGILGRCLVAQTWRQDYDCFERRLRLPLFPVISVTGVTYEDDSGVTQTIDASNYQVLNDELGTFVRFKDTYGFANLSTVLPAVHATYQAGYATAADVPASIKTAMLLLIGNWYENREAVLAVTALQQLPFAVDALLTPLRRTRF